MNDTTELPNTPEDDTSIFTTTEVLDDTSVQPSAAAETDAARPHVRIGAVVWGLVVTIVTMVTITTVLDPVRSREFGTWASNVSGETIGLIALVAAGALILLLGLVSLLRQAQRRGERL